MTRLYCSCLSLLDAAVFATAGLECCGACLTLINSWPVFEFNLNSTKKTAILQSESRRNVARSGKSGAGTFCRNVPDVDTCHTLPDVS
jgi:hypothetical protein